MGGFGVMSEWMERWTQFTLWAFLFLCAFGILVPATIMVWRCALWGVCP